jgi:hypothetical protein
MGGARGTLAELRRQAQAVMKRLQRAGRQQINAIEGEITKLNKQRQALLHEIGAAIGGGRPAAARRGRPPGAARPGRRGRRARVDWNGVFVKLPRGSFRASDVRKIVPGIAAGTLSQRLTGWVKEKKLKRTGSRRGTRYTRAA